MKIIRMIYYWLLILKLSWHWMFQNNLGDEVVYQGKKYFLHQGVSAPYWDLSSTGVERLHVHEKDFRKLKTLKNCLASFQSGYTFYMGYWYRIWVNGGIEDWMLGCNIWPRSWRIK